MRSPPFLSSPPGGTPRGVGRGLHLSCSATSRDPRTVPGPWRRLRALLGNEPLVFQTAAAGCHGLWVPLKESGSSLSGKRSKLQSKGPIQALLPARLLDCLNRWVLANFTSQPQVLCCERDEVSASQPWRAQWDTHSDLGGSGTPRPLERVAGWGSNVIFVLGLSVLKTIMKWLESHF